MSNVLPTEYANRIVEIVSSADIATARCALRIASEMLEYRAIVDAGSVLAHELELSPVSDEQQPVHIGTGNREIAR